MVVNKNRIKARVARAIDAAPTVATFYRTTFVPDGRGGSTKGGDVEVGEFRGLLDNTASNAISLVFNDGGKVRDDTSPKLYVIFNDEFSPRENDYFRIGNIEYRFGKCSNILELDILWLITLTFNEVKMDGEQ